MVAPSAKKFDDDYPEPAAMTEADIARVVEDFSTAAKRSVEAGFQVIEIHAAHGYLLHEFLSPLSNERTDKYGGGLENRMRFPLAVASGVREAVPENLPVFVRISATDWAENGWNIEQSIEFSKRLKEIGIDLIDVSSGGLVPYAKIEIGPGYQVPFASEIRSQARIKTSAVGMITDARQAEHIIENGDADAVMIARESLRDPYFAIHAAQELGARVDVPKQYGRAIEIKKARSV